VEDREYLDNDRLHVRFDADRLTPEMLLQAVHKQGFTAAIVPENPSPP
jgi:hypothetical protein